MKPRTRPRTPQPDPANRPWHLVPPLAHGGEPLEGGASLDEVQGPLGLFLWQTLRDVLLWAETPPADRVGLFVAGAAASRSAALGVTELDEEVAAPLRRLTQMVEHPGSIEAREIGDACTSLAAWAERCGAAGTALAFAQDAALAVPDDVGAALEVARLARRANEPARAELWYRRAIGLARRSRRWRPYVQAFSGLGAVHRDRGNLPAAHRFHLRALRGARRGGLRLERAIALHDLFAVAVDAGRVKEAERYAREAATSYPANSARLSTLAHDVAYFWMEAGHFARALEVFDAVAPLLHNPAARLWAESNRMRAAAGAGNFAVAREAAARVQAASRDPALAGAAARAQLELARGELQMGRWAAARTAARAAIRLGRTHREGRTVLSAESVLQAIDAAESAGRPASPDAPPDSPRRGSTLARTLIEALASPQQAGLHARGVESSVEDQMQIQPVWPIDAARR